MKPLISVLVPSYNYVHYVAKAIDSVLAQTYPNVEVVVTDDGSTDGAATLIAERYAAEPRVRLFANERNLGIVGNFNRALTHARGDFVHWLPSDDWILPEHLARMHAVFEREPQVDVVYARPYFVDEAGRISGVKTQANMLQCDYVDVRDEFPEMLGGLPPLAIPATLLRRALFDELGELDADVPILFDWELFVRLAAAGKRFAFLTDPSCCIRLHAASASGGRFNERGEMGVQGLQIIEKYLGHSALARLRGRERSIVERLDNLRFVDRKRIATSGICPDYDVRFAAARDALMRVAAEYAPALVRDQLVSVVIPALGPYQATIRAIDAVARQTHARWQIVVIDQTTFPLAAALRDHAAWDRIAYVRLASPQPPGAARNLGVRVARGEYVAFLDDDNTVDPDHLETLVALIERSGADVAASGARLVVEDIDARGTAFAVLQRVEDVFRGPNDPPELAAIANALPLNAILHHRRFFEAAGRFSEATLILEDFDYLSRLQSVARFAFTGATTLDVSVRRGLALQSLGRYGPTHYGATLDALYASREVEAALEPLRVAQRAFVAQALRQLPELVATPEGLVELIATLSGRRVFPATIENRS